MCKWKDGKCETGPDCESTDDEDECEDKDYDYLKPFYIRCKDNKIGGEDVEAGYYTYTGNNKLKLYNGTVNMNKHPTKDLDCKCLELEDADPNEDGGGETSADVDEVIDDMKSYFERVQDNTKFRDTTEARDANAKSVFINNALRIIDILNQFNKNNDRKIDDLKDELPDFEYGGKTIQERVDEMNDLRNHTRNWEASSNKMSTF